MQLKLGELFCGPGGIGIGAISQTVSNQKEELSITHEWANDYDKDTCETYIKNICPTNPESVKCIDVRNLDINDLTPIDCFAFGFPCNDFSIVGEQKGFNGTFGPLYSYGVNIINKFNPVFFVAENVSGLSSANQGNAFKKILEDLKIAGSGYNIASHLYKSEQYGVPQTRHRIIIVGIRSDLNKTFKVPAPTHINSAVTCKEALENPPIPVGIANNEFKKMSSIVEERLTFIKPGENVWNANIPNHLKLKETKTKLSQIYKRLDPNKPSYTITGSGGGGTHCYHYDEPRALTNRERARIQTFPDDFVFVGSNESVRKQIGMAVPPLLSSIIFNHILKTLLDIDYQSIKANI